MEIRYPGLIGPCTNGLLVGLVNRASRAMSGRTIVACFCTQQTLLSGHKPSSGGARHAGRGVCEALEDQNKAVGNDGMPVLVPRHRQLAYLQRTGCCCILSARAACDSPTLCERWRRCELSSRMLRSQLLLPQIKETTNK